MRTFIIYWLPPLLWMGFLFPANDALTYNSTSSLLVPIIKWLMPLASQATINTLHIVLRKCSHFMGYAILAFLLFRGFRGYSKNNLKVKWITLSGIIAVSYAFLDEFLQTFISSRTGSIYDCLIDTAGVGFALGMVCLKRKRLGDCELGKR